MDAVGSDYTMPFGKHRGRRLDEIDDSYIAWLYSLDDLREPLAGAIEEEFQRRMHRQEEARRSHRQRRHNGWNDDSRIEHAEPPPPRTKELVEAGFKTLARIHHPDVGGTDEGMRETLEARQWLLRQVSAALVYQRFSK